MAIPGWLQRILAVAMIAVAAYHLARVARPRWARDSRPDVELAHAAMGLAMAAMLVGALSPASSGRLAVGFAVPTAWFAWRAMHSYVMDGPRPGASVAAQAVGPAAMVYMLLLVAAPGPVHLGMSMPARPPAGGSAVLLALVVTATAVAAWWTVRHPLRPRAEVPAPRLGTGCQLAMSATTVCMLVAL